MSPGNCRCTSTAYWCTRGAPLFWSTKSTLPPTPVRMPRLLPDGGMSPFGNGFSSVASGTAVCAADCRPAGRRPRLHHRRRAREADGAVALLRELPRGIEEAVAPAQDRVAVDGPG